MRDDTGRTYAACTRLVAVADPDRPAGRGGDGGRERRRDPRGGRGGLRRAPTVDEASLAAVADLGGPGTLVVLADPAGAVVAELGA